ncbi:Translation machinery-associated protein 22 [Tulasnella sp. UAMH 9824]|nr:Translation machinery-associated protein 22 [Tulasnella sp. UAMH 9824]
MQSLSVEAQAKLEKDTAKKEAKADAKAKAEAEKKQASASSSASLGIELKKAAKLLAQKFATGSSVTKNPQGQDEIVVQGDVSDDVFEIIERAGEGVGGQLGTLFKPVPIDNVVQTEEKAKK